VPLQDHFRPPLSARRHWHSFHNAWATYLAADINRRLPKHYFAEPNVQFGIEIDVATFEEQVGGPLGLPGASWNPPEPTLSVPLALVTDIVEIQVLQNVEGPTLVGAVEMVSPGNKDRPESRDAFVNKCAAYLQQGVGLVIVDIVTERAANLHNELLARVAAPGPVLLQAPLYAVAYRPTGPNGQTRLEIWPEPLAIASPLPTLPLWLRGGLCLPLELETTYLRTCEEQRVSVNGP
jgi:hypothetical protein